MFVRPKEGAMSAWQRCVQLTRRNKTNARDAEMHFGGDSDDSSISAQNEAFEIRSMLMFQLSKRFCFSSYFNYGSAASHTLAFDHLIESISI